MNKLNVALDFSPVTGGRTPEEGEFSGELFRTDLLAPRYKECFDKKEKLEIDFDGCYGVGTSFLEEAFGGLVRKCGYTNILDHIIIIANDDETIPENIIKYVKAAEGKVNLLIV